MTGVFYHSVIHGLGFFICFKYRFYARKTIKHAFSVFYTLIKHGSLTNQNARRVLSIFQLTNKEASTALCSVVKHAGSGRPRQKCRGKQETLYRFLSALQQNRVQSRLLYLFYDKEFDNFPKHSLNFQTKFYFPME